MSIQPDPTPPRRTLRLHRAPNPLSWTGPLQDERAEYRLHSFHITRLATNRWSLRIVLPKGGATVTEHVTHPAARLAAVTFAQSL